MATRKKVMSNLDKVEVRKEDLLAQVKKHLAEHTKAVKKAREAWRKDTIQLFRQNITLLGTDDPKVYELYRERGLKRPEHPPQDYTYIFVEMVSKLEASTAEYVLLQKGEFSLYYDGIVPRHQR